MQWPLLLCFIKCKVIILQCHPAELCAAALDLFTLHFNSLLFFPLHLFKQRGAQFHCLFPNGYFSVVLKQWGFNDTCQSLKFTFIKQTSAAPHEPGEHLVAQSDTFIDRTCC